jgi:1-deoxy-D-xylulose-5-phosphate reductoisomerase
MPADKIDVLVHPQSIIHSMVEYCDGSVLAQMGASDMRTPIANVLAYPDRLKTPGKTLKWSEISALSFEPVDTTRFPSISLAYKILEEGLAHSISFNAANEVAVEAFLDGKIGFGSIMDCIRFTLDSITEKRINSLTDILALDSEVRKSVQSYILSISTRKTVSAL